jgi:hypothetical protein
VSSAEPLRDWERGLRYLQEREAPEGPPLHDKSHSSSYRGEVASYRVDCAEHAVRLG